MKEQKLSPSAEARNLKDLESISGNLYLSTVIIELETGAMSGDAVLTFNAYAATEKSHSSTVTSGRGGGWKPERWATRSWNT